MGIKWRFRNYFFTGLLVVLPVVISALVVFWLFSVFTNLFIRFLPESYDNIAVRVLILVGLVMLVTAVGVVARNVIGRRVIYLGEWILARIPFFNKIYLAVKQISEAFIGEHKTVFKKVVMVEYPRKGLFVIGFQTAESRGEVQGKTKETMVNVFLPTSPNPTSGMLIIVPKKDIMDLDMTVEEGMKMVISGGAVSPENYWRVNGR